MMNVLDFKSYDLNILNKMYENFTDVSTKRVLDKKVYEKQRSQGKWYLHILDNDIYKYVYSKSRDLVTKLYNQDYELFEM